MSVDNIITDEFAERVESLLGELLLGACPPIATNGRAVAHNFARRARALGVGLVDPNHAQALVHERVYQGVLFRLHLAEARAAELENEVSRLKGETDGEYDG